MLCEDESVIFARAARGNVEAITRMIWTYHFGGCFLGTPFWSMLEGDRLMGVVVCFLRKFVKSRRLKYILVSEATLHYTTPHYMSTPGY